MSSSSKNGAPASGISEELRLAKVSFKGLTLVAQFTNRSMMMAMTIGSLIRVNAGRKHRFGFISRWNRNLTVNGRE